jgi:hypothetical protein
MPALTAIPAIAPVLSVVVELLEFELLSLLLLLVLALFDEIASVKPTNWLMYEIAVISEVFRTTGLADGTRVLSSPKIMNRVSLYGCTTLHFNFN